MHISLKADSQTQDTPNIFLEELLFGRAEHGWLEVQAVSGRAGQGEEKRRWGRMELCAAKDFETVSLKVA